MGSRTQKKTSHQSASELLPTSPQSPSRPYCFSSCSVQENYHKPSFMFVDVVKNACVALCGSLYRNNVTFGCSFKVREESNLVIHAPSLWLVLGAFKYTQGEPLLSCNVHCALYISMSTAFSFLNKLAAALWNHTHSPCHFILER